MLATDDVFAALRSILAPYAGKLDTKKDDATELYVDTRHIQGHRKPLFFGAVPIKKSYVSFHLMPLCLDPDLVGKLSHGLRAGMQGKSCFNFSRVDKPLFNELEAATKAGFRSYKQQGFV